MVKNVRNVNTFQQTAGNYARYGAFYTNTDMMYRCGRLLKIENEENKVTVVFEPHIISVSMELILPKVRKNWILVGDSI